MSQRLAWTLCRLDPKALGGGSLHQHRLGEPARNHVFQGEFPAFRSAIARAFARSKRSAAPL